MTTLFQSMVNMVYTETNRPDLIAETQQAVFEATLSAHLTDDYFADIVTMQATFDTADYFQTLDVTTLPNFRNFAFFRKAVPGPTNFAPFDGSVSNPLLPDPVTGCYSLPSWEYRFLREHAADDLVDNYGYDIFDVWYQVGTAINIKSSTQIVNGELGYYAFPVLDIADVATGSPGYTSWIATNFPYVIVYKAAAAVAGKIGQADMFKYYMDPNFGAYFGQLKLLTQHNITAGGR